MKIISGIKIGQFLLALVVSLSLFGCQSGPAEQNIPANLETITSPWASCGVGSFVHYKILMTAGNFIEEKQTVIEVKSNKVILDDSLLNGNEWEHKNMVAVPLQLMVNLDKTIKFTEDTITIEGKSLRCKVEKQIITDPEHGNKKIVMQTWMSDDVPGGVVRISHDSTVIVEVVDFNKK
jgi:hypothetical protein